jgi:hypothetical protein
MPANQKLSPDTQTFIVQSLACFDSPSTVVASVKTEFEIVVSRQLVEMYDPTKRAGSRLGKRWKELFASTREAFLKDSSTIGITHQIVRLRALDRMAARAESQGNLKLAAELHKQAAEEIGGAYTNRRELTGKDGAPLPAVASAVTIFALPDNGRG